MRLLDVNLLLYAVNRDAPHYDRAKAWLEHALSGSETIAFSWPVLLAFMRIGTRAAVFPRPLTFGEAAELVDSWLDQPCSTILQPGPRHWAILRELLAPLGTAGNLTSDAHLAAIALEHGAELVSTDADFARFGGLRWVNPLAER